MGRIYAGVLGLLAFLTILARGLIEGVSSGNLMLGAIAALPVFAAIGWLAGSLAQRTVDEAVQRRFDDEVAAAQQAGPTKS